MAENPALVRMIRPLPADRRGRETNVARCWRLTVPRLAEARLGLVASVEGVAHRVSDHDGLMAGWCGDGVSFLLERGEARGLGVIDAELRAALIEVQTTGRVMATRPPERPGTDVDLALAAPMVGDWIAAVGGETQGALDGWRIGRRLANARVAGMALPETGYSLTEITLSLGGDQRSGRLTLAVPGAAAPADLAPPSDAAAGAALPLLAGYVADLRAVLCRRPMALSELRSLGVGSEIALDHRALGQVAIEAEGESGTALARGRLGRMGDRKAIKLGPEESPGPVGGPETHLAPPGPALPGLTQS